MRAGHTAPVNPALLRHLQERSKRRENRVADRITRFTGDDQPEPHRRERQVIADQQWRTVQEEEQQNKRLLRLSDEILDLTKEIHAASATATPASRPGAR